MWLLLPFIAAHAQDHALRLDGHQDHLLVGTVDPGPAYTIEAWVQIDELAHLTVAGAVDGGSRNAFFVGYRHPEGVWAAETDDDDPFEGDICEEDSPHLCFDPGYSSAPVLVHVALAVDPDTMTLFLDGVAVESALTGAPTDFTDATLALGAGRDSGTLFTDDVLEGLLDEVRLWSVARTEAEIACTRDWQLTGAEVGLVGLWPMDTESSGTTPDLAGAADGTLEADAELVPSPFELQQSIGGDIGCLDGDGDGVTPIGGDCDDTDAATYPGAPELLDGLDNDCDGIVDDSLAPQDTGAPPDTATPGDTGAPPTGPTGTGPSRELVVEADSRACGCASRAPASPLGWWIALLAIGRPRPSTRPRR